MRWRVDLGAGRKGATQMLQAIAGVVYVRVIVRVDVRVGGANPPRIAQVPRSGVGEGPESGAGVIGQPRGC